MKMVFWHFILVVCLTGVIPVIVEELFLYFFKQLKEDDGRSYT